MIAALLVVALAAPAQAYRFPLQLPSSGTQPYITAHRDANAGAGVDDYACGGDAYNGHGGTDIGIGGFAVMDAGGRTAVAAAAGTVGGVRDGCFDRCTSGSCACADGFGNYVRVDHPNGRRTYYAHLKKNSLLVSVGDDVACGTPLGKVGSSGNSTGPHLHFEVRHADNADDDPYAGACGGPTSYWVTQGPYGGLPGTTCAGGATDPPPDPPPDPPAETKGTLRGVVFADTGAGTDDMTTRLDGATVDIVGTQRTTTAAAPDAAWSFEVNPGTKTVRASAPGYVTAERTCDVAAGETAWCSLGLVAAPPPEVDAGAPPPDDDDAGAPADEPGDAGAGDGADDADAGTDDGVPGDGDGGGGAPPNGDDAGPGDDESEPKGGGGDDDDDDAAPVSLPGGDQGASCAQIAPSTAGMWLACVGLLARRRRAQTV